MTTVAELKAKAEAIDAAVVKLLARIDALTAERDALRKALKPFADVVYYDNGDVTYSYSNLRDEDYLRASRVLMAERGKK